MEVAKGKRTVFTVRGPQWRWYVCENKEYMQIIICIRYINTAAEREVAFVEGILYFLSVPSVGLPTPVVNTQSFLS